MTEVMGSSLTTVLVIFKPWKKMTVRKGFLWKFLEKVDKDGFILVMFQIPGGF